MGGRSAEDTPRVRRQPATEAGAAIATAILDAAAEQLVDAGYEAMTTNHVAKRAGVSVGSLYQYFPDKHAIVAALASRERAGFLSRFETEPEGPAAALAGWVDATLEGAAESKPLLAVLFSEVPPAWMIDKRDADEAAPRRFTEQLSRFPSALKSDEVSAFVAFHALRGAARGLLCRRPEALASPGVRAELYHLLESYLALQPLGPPPAPAPIAPPTEAGRVRPPGARPPAHTKRRRATLARLLDAAEEALVETRGGLPQAKAITDAAGLSAASLYRYFPSVEALVGELVHRREARAAEVIGRVLREGQDATLPALARATIDGLMGPEQARPGTRFALAAYLPRGYYLDATVALEEGLESSLVELLEARPDERRDGEPRWLAFVSIHAVQWVLEAATLRRSDLRPEPLATELTRLVVRYLAR